MEDPVKKPAPESAGDPAAENTARNFFRALGDGLKTVGKTAEKYTRLGVAMAEAEKLKLDLRGAHARLGEAIYKRWQETPGAGVAASDESVKTAHDGVRQVFERIRETDARIEALKKEGSDE